jgi:PHD/YefM family antitoxin component YafN of YafNO toxin-antitoxin module
MVLLWYYYGIINIEEKYMLQELPKVIPINELKNTANISKICNDSNVPIIVTKNGYSDIVMMSVDLYQKTVAKLQAAMLINEAVDSVDNGGELLDGEKAFKNLGKKYE